jgi:hypothetical protein
MGSGRANRGLGRGRQARSRDVELSGVSESPAREAMSGRHKLPIKTKFIARSGGMI